MLKKFFASILLFSALNVMLYEVCAENVIYVSNNPYALIQKIVSLQFYNIAVKKLCQK